MHPHLAVTSPVVSLSHHVYFTSWDILLPSGNQRAPLDASSPGLAALPTTLYHLSPPETPSPFQACAVPSPWP